MREEKEIIADFELFRSLYSKKIKRILKLRKIISNISNE